MSLTSDVDLKKKCHKLNIPLIGAYFKDKMPKIKPNSHKMGFIINLSDEITRNGDLATGTHWVALWIDGKEAIYFDSFAVAPPIETVNFLKKMKIKRFEQSDFQIQNPNSGYCGYYCLVFLYMMNNGYSLEQFLDMFYEDVEQNLTILKKIMNLLI